MSKSSLSGTKESGAREIDKLDEGVDGTESSRVDLAAPPAALGSGNPLRLLTVFGPGAIMASLTIRTGELIFSSRGGAIFGYRILFLFLVITLLKWTLVFSTARHMVLTGVHPLRRWLDLPVGPRGWLPAVMFVFAALCIPIWVSFHCAVTGELLATITGTSASIGGATRYLWGILLLVAVLWIGLKRGYQALEKLQLTVVAIMLLVVSAAVVLLQPDWLDLLSGILVPRSLEFPSWIKQSSRPELLAIASRPVWVEASLYVGVIGGASFDYLAYTSFLRDKQWGNAGMTPASEEGVFSKAIQENSANSSASNSHSEHTDADEWERLRLWIRAPLIDCTLSFVVVFFFSAVFVASGWLVLHPAQQIPSEGNFLAHQAQFVTRVHPALYPIYVCGALLAMLGTLYGTLEVAPTIFRESNQLLKRSARPLSNHQLRVFSLIWTAGGAFLVLGGNFAGQMAFEDKYSLNLTTFLIPANLFTGVFSCGIVCLLNPWIDRILPPARRPGVLLMVMNLVAATIFLALGLKGYWDFGGLSALGILAGTILVGGLLAVSLRKQLVESR